MESLALEEGEMEGGRHAKQNGEKKKRGKGIKPCDS